MSIVTKLEKFATVNDPVSPIAMKSIDIECIDGTSTFAHPWSLSVLPQVGDTIDMDLPVTPDASTHRPRVTDRHWVTATSVVIIYLSRIKVDAPLGVVRDYLAKQGWKRVKQ